MALDLGHSPTLNLSATGGDRTASSQSASGSPMFGAQGKLDASVNAAMLLAVGSVLMQMGRARRVGSGNTLNEGDKQSTAGKSGTNASDAKVVQSADSDRVMDDKSLRKSIV